MKITVIGSGYVGLSSAVMFSTKYEVDLLDTNNEKIKLVVNKQSPIADRGIEDYLLNKDLKLNAFSQVNKIDYKSDFFIIALPTNFDEQKQKFNTELIDHYIDLIFKNNLNSIIVIKSTVYVGYCESISRKYNTNNVIFNPEFLREGSALYDNLNPDRVVLGGDFIKTNQYSLLLKNLILNNSITIFYISLSEAESVKLFSNTYLAMRVAFFNEVDNFCETNNLESKNVIKPISFDKRIGDYYNNPSFGYGGYCLPKDTKQMISQLTNGNNDLIKAIDISNENRIKKVAENILKLNPYSVGIYRLQMKKDSDNYRESPVIHIAELLVSHNIKVTYFEPNIKVDLNEQIIKINDFKDFINLNDIILANRITTELEEFKEKVYSRDLFERD